MASTTHDDRLVATSDDRSGPHEFDDGGPEAPARRRGLTAFVVVVGALAVGAGAWYVTQKLTKTGGQAGGELPLLIAESEPVKVKPEDPGGADIPNRGTYVYKSLESETTEQPVEQLLPAPEEPLPKPVATGPKLEPVGNVALDEMWSPAPPSDGTPAPEAAPAPSLSTLLEKATGADGQGATEASPEAGAAPQTEPFTPEAPAETLADAADRLALEPEVIEVPAVSPEASGVWLQVASLRNEADAAPEWSRLVRRYPAALDTMQHRILPADLGDRGLWYRLQAGPFADVASAEAACGSIAAAGGSCQVVKPE